MVKVKVAPPINPVINDLSIFIVLFIIISFTRYIIVYIINATLLPIRESISSFWLSSIVGVIIFFFINICFII